MTGVVEASHPAAAVEAPEPPAPAPRRRWRPVAPSHRVLGVAVALILLQLVLRSWIARSGVLSQEDLVVAGRSARQPLLSAEFLLSDDDRFAPLADLVTAGLTRLAPLEYWPMAVTLVLFQALASLAVLRLLRLLLGDRPVLLLPLCLYLFSPLALSAFDTWTTAIAAVPFQAGLAWVCGDALALHRTGRKRYAVTGVLALVITAGFGEKAVVIPVVAFAVLAVALHQSGEERPVGAALRGGRWLWAGLGAACAAFLWRFGSTVEPRPVPAERSGSLTAAVDALGTTVADGILPGLVGGPVFWSEIGTWADPPAAVVVGAAVAVAAAVVGTTWRRQGSGVVWALVALYVGAGVGLLLVGRFTTGVSAEFALNLRSFSDLVLVVAIAGALLLRAPVRPTSRAVLDRTERRDAAVLLVVFFVALSLWSTTSYDRTRDNQPTRDYLATAQESLRTAEAPVLDHPVSSSVVWGLSAPYNRVSWVFAPVGLATATSTDQPRVLGPDGTLVAAEVTAQHASAPGPRADCGHYVAPERSTRVALTRAAPEAGWTVQVNYLASSDGWILVTPQDGEAEVAPVRQGANIVYLSLRGGGRSLTIGSETPGMSVCVSAALLGVLEAAG